MDDKLTNVMATGKDNDNVSMCLKLVKKYKATQPSMSSPTKPFTWMVGVDKSQFIGIKCYKEVVSFKEGQWLFFSDAIYKENKMLIVTQRTKVFPQPGKTDTVPLQLEEQAKKFNPLSATSGGLEKNSIARSIKEITSGEVGCITVKICKVGMKNTFSNGKIRRFIAVCDSTGEGKLCVWGPNAELELQNGDVISATGISANTYNNILQLSTCFASVVTFMPIGSLVDVDETLVSTQLLDSVTDCDMVTTKQVETIEVLGLDNYDYYRVCPEVRCNKRKLMNSTDGYICSCGKKYSEDDQKQEFQCRGSIFYINQGGEHIVATCWGLALMEINRSSFPVTACITRNRASLNILSVADSVGDKENSKPRKQMKT